MFIPRKEKEAVAHQNPTDPLPKTQAATLLLSSHRIVGGVNCDGDPRFSTLEEPSLNNSKFIHLLSNRPNNERHQINRSCPGKLFFRYSISLSTHLFLLHVDATTPSSPPPHKSSSSCAHTTHTVTEHAYKNHINHIEHMYLVLCCEEGCQANSSTPVCLLSGHRVPAAYLFP